MEEKSILLEVIGDTMENRIIDFLIEGVGIDYTKKDIAGGCDISRPTLYKILPKLIKQGIIKPTRKIGRVQMYSLNAENEKVKALIKLEEFLLKKSFDEVEKQKVKIRV
ncbi:MAG: winged helix-turn-helix transcriptional regulator [Candidatus Aenigmarchaeota archaeon]|nr:winged helix-turn-helix transcriptional regulator [Candidatus Aenigmarchaeota archaeon]